ncbi:MAG TPA: phosphohistidine phosphatase SixA [Terriglobales bacterium]|jgi:phosphohistidine phosphatase|nr:phosphohistidine phosphatase SixA [Terriglobales bacterium]
MIIYFLRHASAGEPFASPKKDEKRALDKEGIEQCGMVGRVLAALDVQVDTIISSPLKRSTQTASLVGNELSYEGKLQLENALRPGASYTDFRRMLEKYARQESIMVVGHNPNLSEFAGRVISEPGCEANVDLKKGAVAKVDMGRNSAVLQWCITPRLLRGVHAAVAESSRPKISRK